MSDTEKGIAVLSDYVQNMNEHGSFKAGLEQDDDGVTLNVRRKDSYQSVIKIHVGLLPSKQLAFDMTQLAVAAVNEKQKGGSNE